MSILTITVERQRELETLKKEFPGGQCQLREVRLQNNGSRAYFLYVVPASAGNS
jgi:hypothetical protein